MRERDREGTPSGDASSDVVHGLQATPGTSLSDTGAAAEKDRAGPNKQRNRSGWVFGVAGSIVLLDQLTKAWALSSLDAADPVELLGGWLSLSLVFNSGAAFGLAQGQTIIITLLASVVTVVIARMARHLFSLPWAIALGAMLGGAIGNLIDRVLRDPAPLRGNVIDFLDVGFWPVFNLADVAVVCGAIGVGLLTILGVEYAPENHKS